MLEAADIRACRGRYDLAYQPGAGGARLLARPLSVGAEERKP